MSNANSNSVKKKFSFNMPHTYVIIFGLIIVATILAYLIPAGEFARITDPSTGKMIVDPTSFKFVEGIKPGFFDIFTSVQRGMVDASGIMFFIVFAYGFVYMLIENGTMNNAITALVKKMGNRIELIIPVSMMIFGALGAFAGLYEEVYGLIPVFIGLAISLGYDSLVGGACVMVAVITGYASGITNPFQVVLAQGIAGVPVFSGMAFRIIIFLVFQITAIIYTMRYARKIKADPEKSLMKGIEIDFLKHSDSAKDAMNSEFTTRQKICLGVFIFTISFLVYGSLKLGWYIDELAGLFFMMMIVVGLIGGFSLNKISSVFVDGAKSVLFGVLACGFCRAITLIIQDAQIGDTIVHYMATSLQGTSSYVSAMGMVVIQNIIHFFITGSTSGATITMPIFAPLSEVIGLNKQIAVLAYQFGNGYTNLFWPTCIALECGLMGIPLNKWYKFITPLMGIFFGLQLILICIAVAIGFH